MKKIITLITVVLLMVSCGTELYPPTDYELSEDGKTLIEWLNKDSDRIDMQGDKYLRKVTTIGNHAFMNMKNLQKIILPKNLERIESPKNEDAFGTGAFAGCSLLDSINIPTKVRLIPRWAFANCKSLNTIVIEDQSKIRIDDEANVIGSVLYPSSDYELSADGKTLIRWLNEHTESVNMEGDIHLRNVTEIGRFAFTNLSDIGTIILPKGLEVIKAAKVGDPENTGAFSRCLNLSFIEIPEKIKVIPEYAFYKCVSLQSVSLPDGLKEIETWAFMRCRSLGSVTIPKSVNSMSGSSFSYCNLTSMTMESSTPPVWKREIWDDIYYSNPELIIYVPDDSVEDYRNTDGWSRYPDRIRAK